MYSKNYIKYLHRWIWQKKDKIDLRPKIAFSSSRAQVNWYPFLFNYNTKLWWVSMFELLWYPLRLQSQSCDISYPKFFALYIFIAYFFASNTITFPLRVGMRPCYSSNGNRDCTNPKENTKIIWNNMINY